MKARHVIAVAPSGGWTCGCGESGAAGNGSVHLAVIAQRALRRLSDGRIHRCAVVTAWTGSRREEQAVFLITRRRATCGVLRAYLVPAVDGATGRFLLHVDWRRLTADLDTGDVMAPRSELALLRCGASLAGVTRVNLGELFSELEVSDLRALHTALTRLMPAA